MKAMSTPQALAHLVTMIVPDAVNVLREAVLDPQTMGLSETDLQLVVDALLLLRTDTTEGRPPMN